MWGNQVNQLIKIGNAGIKGCKISGSTVGGSPIAGGYAQPGYGYGYQASFDGGNSGISVSGNRVGVWNFGILPVSGNQLWPCTIMNGSLWANPNGMCHAVVSGDIQPVSGTTPGYGYVRTYFYSNGGETYDQQILCENWFSITAQSGLNCTVASFDGYASLEVLDCPSNNTSGSGGS